MIPYYSSWLARYTKLLAFATFLLIIAGGLVTSTKSGLSVPDWPLSYGRLMPPMVGGIRYEHTHRLIASLVGMMTLALVLWLGFKESRAWVRWTGIAAFGAVVIQGILGGLTVIYLLPAPISIFHACLAQTFFALTVSLAFFTSKECENVNDGTRYVTGQVPSAKSEPVPAVPGTVDTEIKQPLWMLITLIYLQLILGATLRHTSNQLIVISHIVNGFFVLIGSIIVMLRVFQVSDTSVIASEAPLEQAPVGRLVLRCRTVGTAKQSQIEIAAGAARPRNDFIAPALFLGISALLQMALGMGAFIYVLMLPQTIQSPAGKIFFVTAHQTLGALLLGTCVFLILRVYRKGTIS